MTVIQYFYAAVMASIQYEPGFMAALGVCMLVLAIAIEVFIHWMFYGRQG